MKLSPTARPERGPILAFGAHPDDIEFGCGGIILRETRAGRKALFVICSRGEAASHGTPKKRALEARAAASILGASVEFLELDGDAHLDEKAAHRIALARIIRRVKPGIVLAPSLVENQHPDHWRLGKLVRDGLKLARYRGLAELKALPTHGGAQFFYYAVGSGAEPLHPPPILVDISDPQILSGWTRSMQAHASQAATRDYVDFQLTRAKLHGLSAGVKYALPLYPNGSLLIDSLACLERSPRS